MIRIVESGCMEMAARLGFAFEALDLVSDSRAIDSACGLIEKGEPFEIYTSLRAKAIPPLQAALRKPGCSLIGTVWKVFCLGDSKAHPLVAIGVARLLKERGGDVLIVEDHDNPTLNDEQRSMAAKYGLMGGGANSAGPAWNRQGPLGADPVPEWFPWERHGPHAAMSIAVYGCPALVSPSLFHLLVECLAHFKPDAFIDVHAYKCGVTAFMGMASHAYGIPVYSVNRPMYADAELYGKIAQEPWGSNVKQIRWDPFDSQSGLLRTPKAERPLIFVNMNELDGFKRATDIPLRQCSEALIVLQSPTHGGSPAIVSHLMANKRVAKVDARYKPEYPHWCEGGLFHYATS